MKEQVVILIILIFSFSCEKKPYPVSPSLQIPAESLLKNIEIKQISYDSLQVTNTEDFILDEECIQLVYLGKKIDDTFIVISMFKPKYLNENNRLKTEFKLISWVPNNILNFNFTIRYLYKDNGFSDIDTTFTMCKYPYRTAEVYKEWDEILDSATTTVQDFDLTEKFLYFHPYGPEGLYQYNFKTKTIRLLYNYPGGDFIAADSIYVFVDMGHRCIYRYNILSDKVDLEYDLLILGYDCIMGMDISKKNLYVLVAYYPNTLIEFDFDLNVIREIPVSSACLDYSITVFENVVYSVCWEEITRFNLYTFLCMPGKPKPSGDTFTIRIVGDALYFNDHDRHYIGKVLLNDFLNLPIN